MFVRFRYLLASTILLLVAIFASGCPFVMRAIPINIPVQEKGETEVPSADVLLPD